MGKLKDLRNEKKLTQQQVADLVGISLRSYKAYENDFILLVSTSAAVESLQVRTASDKMPLAFSISSCSSFVSFVKSALSAPAFALSALNLFAFWISSKR